MENLAEAVSAFLKLVHYSASGLGSVAGTMLAPWKARREAMARQIAAQGEADSLRILAEGQASAVQIISGANEEARSVLMGEKSIAVAQFDIGETIRQRLEFQEEKRQCNIFAVLNEAAEQLGDKEVQDHEPDHDWTARFFNEVQDVSSDDMRTIWSKILAGEVERPGSTSARTLTVLKNLDRASARVFNTLCSISVSIRSTDQRQLVLPVGDDYFCRSPRVIIRYRRCRIGYRSASRNTEAETNGRKDATDGGGNVWDERALGPQVAVRPVAVGDQD